MIHQIENDFLVVGVKTTGAELCQLTHKASGKEYMWQADPAFWANHAPVLFPIVGGLKDGTYFFEGKAYQLPKHGIVRYNETVVLSHQTADQLTFTLQSSEQSLTQYPFQFQLNISFRLTEKGLSVIHEVINQDSKTMYFSLGGHPAFNCPLHAGEKYEDYYIEFEHTETLSTWLLDETGLVGQEGPRMLDQQQVLRLHEHIFDQDALIFKAHTSNKVSLKSDRSTQVLSVAYEGWPYLGLWAKPGAPYVCIEPWLGIADAHDTTQQLTEKEGILSLEAGGSFTAAYHIEIQA